MADLKPDPGVPVSHVIWAMRNFYPELGGGSERFRRYLPGLRARGINVSVVCTTRDSALPCGSLVEEGLPIHRHYLPYPTPSLSDLTLAQGALGMSKSTSAFEAPKAVQFHGLRSSMLPSLWRLKRRGVRILQVVTILAAGEEKTVPVSARRWAGQMLSRLTERMCSKIVVSSAVMGDDRLRLGATRRQIQVISNGVDLRRFSPVSMESKAELRARLGIAQNAHALLYMGVMTPRKRVDWLIQAFHQMRASNPMARLYLVGPVLRPTMQDMREASFQTQFQQELLALAGDQLNRTIFFMDETQEPESWFRAADVFAFASLNEGLGNVLLEAMACGLPVLTTPFIGRAAELGIPGTDYLLTAETIESLGAGMNRLANEPDLGRQLSRAALNHVQVHHDLEKTLDAYAALYHNR